jgi:hypothetical protein
MKIWKGLEGEGGTGNGKHPNLGPAEAVMKSNGIKEELAKLIID